MRLSSRKMLRSEKSQDDYLKEPCYAIPPKKEWRLNILNDETINRKSEKIEIPLLSIDDVDTTTRCIH